MYGVVRKSYPPSYLSLNFEIILLIFRKKVMHWFLFHVWLVENQSQRHCSESITRNVQHKGLWEEAYLKKIYHKLKFTSVSYTHLTLPTKRIV